MELIVNFQLEIPNAHSHKIYIIISFTDLIERG